MGSSQGTPISAPPTRSKRSTQLLGTRITRSYRSTRTSTNRSHSRPFKRRATPAPISRQARSGENARPAKRHRRAASETSERSGGGSRRRDTDGLDTGTIPELFGEPSGTSGEPGESRPGEPTEPAGYEGQFGSTTNVLPEDHEGSMLRCVLELDSRYFAGC